MSAKTLTRKYTVVVEFTVQATEPDRAVDAVLKGLDNGIGDVGEIDGAHITEVEDNDNV